MSTSADFIRTLPQGFDEPVLERGATLSTGQKQLISFARALAHAPGILILDEATSSVDTETELRVRLALERMITGRTSVLIAHRLSTIQRADTILVMHKGQLREQGTHQELLMQRGLYWKLYQLQYQDQEMGSAAAAATSEAVSRGLVSPSDPDRIFDHLFGAAGTGLGGLVVEDAEEVASGAAVGSWPASLCGPCGSLPEGISRTGGVSRHPPWSSIRRSAICSHRRRRAASAFDAGDPLADLAAGGL